MDDFGTLPITIEHWQSEAYTQRAVEQDPRVSGYWHGKYNAYQDVLEEMKRILEARKVTP